LGPLVPLTAVSAANYSNVPKLGRFFTETLKLRSESFFAILDNTTCLWLMPLAGLMTLLYVSYVWGNKSALEEMNCFNAFDWLFSKIWLFVVRYISPVLVIMAFLKGIGIFF
jgi:NSS family neurotransmitter:Na+ symporter